MAKTKEKKETNQHKKPVERKQEKENEKHEEEAFDFGGIPKNVDLKKNMGCGG